jgi:CheY-like chemotaxis protein
MSPKIHPKIHVLIVEDDPDQAESMRRVLASRTEVDYAADVVGNVAEAVAFLKSPDGIDVVLLDLGLPDSQGTDTIERVKAACAPVPIIALTGWSGPEYADKAKAAGAADLLTKPAQPADVSEKLQLAVIYRQADQDKAEMGKMLEDFRAILEKLRPGER